MGNKKPPSTVRSVMSKPVITTRKVSSVLEATEIMGRRNAGSIVITHKGKPIGIVTERVVIQKVVARGLEANT